MEVAEEEGEVAAAEAEEVLRESAGLSREEAWARPAPSRAREFRRCAKRMAPRIRRTLFELCTPRRTCRYSASSSAKGTSAAGVGMRRTTSRRSTGWCCGESMYLTTVLAYMNCPGCVLHERMHHLRGRPRQGDGGCKL